MLQFQFTLQLVGVFNFPSIPVGNKTEWKGLNFLPHCDSSHFGVNTAMKIQIRFLRNFGWDCSGMNHSYVLCLASTEWKRLKFCGGRKTSPRISTIVQFIFCFGPLRSAIIV